MPEQTPNVKFCHAQVEVDKAIFFAGAKPQILTCVLERGHKGRHVNVCMLATCGGEEYTHDTSGLRITDKWTSRVGEEHRT